MNEPRFRTRSSQGSWLEPSYSSQSTTTRQRRHFTMWNRIPSTFRSLLIPLAIILGLLFYFWPSSSSPSFPSQRSSSTQSTLSRPDKSGKYTLRSDYLRAQFVPYGAAISNLFVKDKDGIERDIVLGFDTAKEYAEARRNDHLGGIVGRYANRIRNASFAFDGAEYYLPKNEGRNMLHGGTNGWDSRDWEVMNATESEIIFAMIDHDGAMGFPGKVRATVKYSLHRKLPIWDIQIRARVYEKKTPLMLTSHVYWNLDGWGNKKARTVLDHTLALPYSKKYIKVDEELIPTGEIVDIGRENHYDFFSTPRRTLRGAVTREDGLDICYIVADDPRHANGANYIAKLRSEWSKISVDVYSDQAGFQVYTCQGEDGKRRLKKTQGGGQVQKYGCVVMEAQDWIDAINHPEWGRKPVWAPEDGEYVVNIRHHITTK